MDFRRWLEDKESGVDTTPDVETQGNRPEWGPVIGNLGSKIVGTLSAWVGENGFLVRVKNRKMLESGVKLILESLSDLNRKIARLNLNDKDLNKIVNTWFLTAGARLQGFLSKDKNISTKSLNQLVLLAPKLEGTWSEFVASNDLGITVTDQDVFAEPTGNPEEE